MKNLIKIISILLLNIFVAESAISVNPVISCQGLLAPKTSLQKEKFEAWLRKAILRDLEKTLFFFENLHRLIRGLHSSDEIVRQENALALKSLIEAGLITKEAVRQYPLPIGELIRGLSHSQGGLRYSNAESLKTLIETGLLDREKIREYPMLLENLIDGLRDSYGPMRHISAECLSLLSKQNLVNKEEIWKYPLPLDALVHGLRDPAGSIHQNSAEALTVLIEAGLISKRDLRNYPLAIANLIDDLRDSSGYTLQGGAEALKALTKAGLIDKEIVNKNPIPVDELVHGLGSSNGEMRLCSAMALKSLIEAGLIDKESVSKHLILFGEFTREFQEPDSATVMKEWNIRVLAVLIEVGLVNKEQIKKYQLPTADIIRGLRHSSSLVRGHNTEALKALLVSGMVSKEEISQHSLPIDNLRRDLVHGSDGYIRQRSAEVLQLLSEFGLINKEAVFEEPTSVVEVWEELIRGLSYGYGTMRRNSAEALKSLIKAGLLRKEEIVRFDPSEIENLFLIEVDSITLNTYGLYWIYYYCLKLIKELQKEDPQVVYTIFGYITNDLLELSQLTATVSILTNDLFYTRLAQMIKEKTPVPQTSKALVAIMQEELANHIASSKYTMNETEFADALSNLSQLVTCSIKHGYIIEGEKIKGAFQLLAIELQDGGNSHTTTSTLAENVLTKLPPLRLETLPIPAPVFQTLRTEDVPMDVRKGHALRAALRGAKLYKVMLRTLVYKTKTGEFIALKFLKGSRITGPQGERESTEDPGKLLYESEFFDYLNRLKEEGVPLIADYPHSLLIEGQRVIRISEKYLPVEMKDRLGLASRQAAKPNELNWPDTTDGYYTLMAYTIKTPDYFTYLHEAEEEQVEEATERNIHDLFILARYGLIHPDIIELFHNLIQIGRTDRGHFLWMADIIRPLVTRQGTGRLHAWEPASEYPNYRLSGPADFAEMVNLEDLLTLRHPHSIYLGNDLLRFARPEIEKFILAHFMGNYTLAWALDKGKRLKMRGELNRQISPILEERVKDVYRRAYFAFTGEEDTEISDIIDWQRLARQMAFFMGGHYRNYSVETLPRLLYDISNLQIRRGDGWGFIHYDVIKSRLALKSHELSGVLNTYFTQPSSLHRTIPLNIYIFKPEFFQVLDTERNTELYRRLASLHQEYFRGWRFDGRNEDLGPVNGPFPLQELIKANYVYTMFMLAKGPQSPHLISPANIKSDARGTHALGGAL